MKYLLDTHTFIWTLKAGGDQLLSKKALEIILDLKNELYVSSISLWELAIKTSIGKLELGKDFDVFIENDRKASKIKILNYSIKHIKKYAELPIYGVGKDKHADPFDRMIICQSLVDNMPIISVDGKFRLYPKLKVIW